MFAVTIRIPTEDDVTTCFLRYVLTAGSTVDSFDKHQLPTEQLLPLSITLGTNVFKSITFNQEALHRIAPHRTAQTPTLDLQLVGPEGSQVIV